MDFIDPEMETVLARTAENIYDIISWISAKTMYWCMYYLIADDSTDYRDNLSDYVETGVISHNTTNRVVGKSSQLLSTTLSTLHQSSSKNKLTDDWTVIDISMV